MSCGIYKITNQLNNKSYIGQSINIESRWNHHKNYSMESAHYPLYQAFKKYGVENFTFEIIELCSKEKLNEKEIYWIQKYNTYYNGYNQTTGGQSGNENNTIKISKEDICIIYDLLQNSSITQREIALIFNVGEDTISEINQGKTRINPELTYPLRNNHKKIAFCKECGVVLSDSRSLRCIACEQKRRRVCERPSREELKNLIRNKSFVQIGKQFGVSDNTIRKWCDAENLPRKVKDIKSYSNEEWDLI